MNRCREIIFCDIISAAVGFYIKGNYEKEKSRKKQEIL
jgi:hypothetical protein